jgi:hypothetical protein
VLANSTGHANKANSPLKRKSYISGRKPVSLQNNKVRS